MYANEYSDLAQMSSAAFAGMCAQNAAEADQAEYNRSRDWIARELGDVPMRGCGDVSLAQIQAEAWLWVGGFAPVESLGRDA